MSFTSLTYLLFLPTVFAVYWLLRDRVKQNFWLAAASYFFYGWWDWRFCFLMLISSMVDYVAAIGIETSKTTRSRRLILLFSCLINFGMLGFFKYANFFSDNIRAVAAAAGIPMSEFTIQVTLPVGISFYTFQTMSYAFDVYFGKMRASRNLIDYLAYVSFFPQLVAGPIERATHFLPQFSASRSFNLDQARSGCRQIIWGVVKKLLLADNFALTVDLCYGDVTAYNGVQLAFATLCFAFQIYCDFSAYSDIATGSARLFGFELMRNFAYPYFSQDVTEFWRRWHISLSTWFRDYIFFPLGGSLVGPLLRMRNVMLTFVLSGLWHGASWNFIIWGFLNGLALLPAVLRGTRYHLKPTDTPGGEALWPGWWTLTKILGTFLFICFTWIFFRAQTLTESMTIIQKIGMDLTNPSAWQHVVVGRRLNMILPCFLLLEWVQRRHEHPLVLPWAPRWARWVLYTILIWGTLLFMPGASSPFIYFQF